MAKHPIYLLAEEENTAIAAEFLGSPMGEKFAAFLRNQQTMAAYAQAPTLAPAAPAGGGLVRRKPTGNGESESARVVAGAKAYLAAEGKRHTSGEITRALLADGIEIGGGDDKASRVSAHMSSAKHVFNNDRARGGYGLIEWGDAK